MRISIRCDGTTTIHLHGELGAATMLDIRDEMRTVGSSKVHSIEASLRHLISLVRILAVSGFVSFENADVLTDALDDLGSFMETSRRSVLSENIRLSRDDLLGVVDTAQESIKDIKDKESIMDTDILILKVDFPNQIWNNTHYNIHCFSQNIFFGMELLKQEKDMYKQER